MPPANGSANIKPRKKFGVVVDTETMLLALEVLPSICLAGRIIVLTGVHPFGTQRHTKP
jgi:hypothetical protein